MQVEEITGFIARCHARGVEREVSLFMLQDQAIEPGDFVQVQVGYAIQKVSPEEARAAWELFDEILAASGPGVIDGA